MKKLKAKFKNLKETFLDPKLKQLIEEGMAEQDIKFSFNRDKNLEKTKLQLTVQMEGDEFNQFTNEAKQF